MSWLHSFSFPESDLDYLDIDANGGVYYSDMFTPEEAGDTTGGTEPPAEGMAPADVFTLHSRPGSPNVVFLDFDGHTISGTAWNSGGGTLQAKPYDTDGSPVSFSQAEMDKIAEVWHRMAEDFAPFDIDVTTEEPANFGPTTGHVLVTADEDETGKAMPSKGAGGVAYVNVWGRTGSWDYQYYSPAFVYYDNLGSGFPPYVAEAASHELGHNLSLSHDGAPGTSYYSGHGAGFVSWAPIMGVGYYNNVTQWSKGEYDDATQTQDDIALIEARLSYRDDDHGNILEGSTPLLVEPNGDILVSNPETDPHNTYPENKGVVETRTDVDLFYFDAAAGPVNLTVTPAWDAFYRSSRRGANLDIEAVLYDSAGDPVAQDDPPDETDAVISGSVGGGRYYLAISGVGNGVVPYSDYGSLGQYYISGFVTPGTYDSSPEVTLTGPAAGSTVSGTVSVVADASDDDAVTQVEFFVDGSSIGVDSTGTDGWSKTWNSAAVVDGGHTISVTATDTVGQTGSDSIGVTVENVNDPPVASFAHTCDLLSCDFDASGSSDPDGSIASYAWDFGDSSSGGGALVNHLYGAAGTYTVVLTVTDDGGEPGSTTQVITVIEALPTLHVGDLDGSSAPAARGRWEATVTVTVHDEFEEPVADATVSGSWSGGVTGGGSCVTDGNGQCSVNKGNIKGNVPSGVFTVESVTHAGLGLVAAQNHDPDGDSDGTVITVYRDAPPANQPPTADFAYQPDALDALTITFTDQSTDGDGAVVAWNWDFGDGSGASTDRNPVYTYAAAGTYRVTLTVTDDAGESGAISQDVPVDVAGAAIHVGDLDGSTSTARGGKWSATVTVTVHDVNESLVEAAVVSGTWSAGATGGASCTTNGSGQCSVSKNSINSNVGSVTFTIDSVAHGADSYDAEVNHDPDGNSADPFITVSP